MYADQGITVLSTMASDYSDPVNQNEIILTMAKKKFQ